MIKYRTGGWNENGQLIEAIECERETETSVWIRGGRQLKRTSFINFFDTWEDAKQFLLDKAEANCGRYKQHLS